MRAALRKYAERARKFDGQKAPPPDKFVRTELLPITFGDLARFAWPTKTEIFLLEAIFRATGEQYDERTCRRWMAEQNEPPAEALAEIWVHILRRFQLR